MWVIIFKLLFKSFSMLDSLSRFCFLRCCGCVFSERALKEIKAEVCHTVSC